MIGTPGTEILTQGTRSSYYYRPPPTSSSHNGRGHTQSFGAWVGWCTRQTYIRQFHVNMLREWHTTSESSSLCPKKSETKGKTMYIVFWKEDGGGSPVISEKLTPQQAGELTTLLQEFSDVLRNEPGRTTITEHSIYRY